MQKCEEMIFYGQDPREQHCMAFSFVAESDAMGLWVMHDGRISNQ
jgi:hypothetical protein